MGLPVLPTALVQSLHVLAQRGAVEPALRVAAGQRVVVVDAGGRVLLHALFVGQIGHHRRVPIGAVSAMSPETPVATSRPSRSYHGPVPTRSIALTGPAVVLKKARQVWLPKPSLVAMVWQILSAPSSPDVIP